MDRYKRLLVGLDLSDEDQSTIEYAALISRMAKSEAVCFVHVAGSLDIPNTVRAEYPDLVGPAAEHKQARLTEMVQTHFDGHPGAQAAYQVIEGSPLVELLRLAREQDCDLILVGRKHPDRISGTLAERLARKAPCSVLIVPEGSEPRITKLLVPVDFSEHSSDAMDVAVSAASASDLHEFLCLHAYRVPIGYGKTGKSYDEFGQIMRTHAVRDYEAFIRNHDLKGITATSLFQLDTRPANAIGKVVAEQKVDLLVVGARGRTAAAAVLLGSVTEGLIRTINVPLLAVKKKGAGMSFLTAVLLK